jgi:hypothetical protein
MGVGFSVISGQWVVRNRKRFNGIVYEFYKKGRKQGRGGAASSGISKSCEDCPVYYPKDEWRAGKTVYSAG